ncbi:Fungalysin metallopeptidase-domain-containing protein [Syncephalis plumigaleata]|nr:Fungalysin metallopeptidase-domain-containing protein [Syncephalis plumigaleata]
MSSRVRILASQLASPTYTLNRCEIANGDISVNVDAKGTIIAYGDNFYRNADASKRKLWAGQSSPRFVEPNKAFVSLADHIGRPIEASKITVWNKPEYVLSGIPYAKDEVIAKQSYIQTSEGALEATWEFLIDLGDNYFDAHISADGTSVVALNDWVADAMYNVVQVGDDFTTGVRRLVKNPSNKKASPHGWHDYEGRQTNTTIGNNVNASVKEDKEMGISLVQPVSKKQEFNYPLDRTKEPDTYREAAITNLFYMTNVLHDIYYQYGFDEAAGNFQEDNYGKGGVGHDGIMATTQSARAVNNAYFATPPDGRRPRMTMLIWKNTQPSRDSSLDNDIIVHEYTHGLSSRLTGGPKNLGCLGHFEAGGMGEGWGDFFGVWLRLKASNTRNDVLGSAIYANGKHIRKLPYSTDFKINPATYGMVYTKGWAGVHQMAVIWTNTLLEMYWNLVDKLGSNANKYSVDLTKGNTLTAKLIIDGMKLQPCRPTFISARDAILQAEQQNTGGKHKCEIWAAFAKRGLGMKARTDGKTKTTEDFSLPDECDNRSIET